MAKKPVRKYACKRMIFTIGTHVMSGFADDSFFELSPNGEGTQKTVGCDAEVAISLDPDDTFTGKFSLLQTSDDIAFIRNAYKLHRETGQTWPFTATNLLGGEVFKCKEWWPKNYPAVTYGKTITMRDAEFDTGSGDWDDTMEV
jgi:hypothetical protein